MAVDNDRDAIGREWYLAGVPHTVVVYYPLRESAKALKHPGARQPRQPSSGRLKISRTDPYRDQMSTRTHSIRRLSINLSTMNCRFAA